MGTDSLHTYSVITVRFMRDVGAIALERVPRGEAPLMPASELLKWNVKTGQPPVSLLAEKVNGSSVVKHDEVAHYAGADSRRNTAYFVCCAVPKAEA